MKDIQYDYHNIPDVSQSVNEYIRNTYSNNIKGYQYLSENDLMNKIETGGFIRAIHKNTLVFNWGGKVCNTRDIDSFIRCYNLQNCRYNILYIRDYHFFYKPPIKKEDSMRKMLRNIIVNITKKN